MGCIPIGSSEGKVRGWICGMGNPHAKFISEDGERYYMDFHNYCGPTFYKDAEQTEEHDMCNIPQDIWDRFDIWFQKKIKK